MTNIAHPPQSARNHHSQHINVELHNVISAPSFSHPQYYGSNHGPENNLTLSQHEYNPDTFTIIGKDSNGGYYKADLYELHNPELRNSKGFQLMYDLEQYIPSKTEGSDISFPKVFNIMGCSMNKYNYDPKTERVTFELHKQDTGSSSLIDSDIQFITGNSDTHTIVLGNYKYNNTGITLPNSAGQATPTGIGDNVDDAPHANDWSM